MVCILSSFSIQGFGTLIVGCVLFLLVRVCACTRVFKIFKDLKIKYK